jgi:hypothetical protein
LVGVVLLAAIGSLAARRIRSPAQIAADTAAPVASRISVPVERRTLATEVIARGTVRYGAPREVTLPVSTLKTSTSVISRVPKPGARLGEGEKGPPRLGPTGVRASRRHTDAPRPGSRQPAL